MTSTDLNIGDYTTFTEGVAAAEITGETVSAATEILGSMPPYRFSGESEELGFDATMKARPRAIERSGVFDMALAARDLDREITFVLVNGFGALALKCEQREAAKDAKKLAEFLSDGRMTEIITPHVVVVL